MPEPLPPKTILLVEDEAIIAMGTKMVLEKNGYSVIHVLTGEKAVETVRNTGINLILMDIDLGKDRMDGTETAVKILEEHTLPIIFLTSHCEKEMVDKVKGITRYGYVLKNGGEFVLLEAITMAFELFQAHQITKESEDKYRAAFMTSPDAVNINRLDGLYVDINEGFTSLTGYTREDVIGKLSSEIEIWAIPEDREKLVDGLQRNGEVKNLESIFRRKDGTLTTAIMSARILTLGGAPHILSVTRDISLRKKAEEEAEKAKLFLDTISDIAYEADTEGNITYVNPAIEDIIGISPDDIIGKPFLPLFIEKDHESLNEVYQKTLEGSCLENTLTFTNGAVCHFTTLPRYDKKNGKIIGTFGVARNITEYLRLKNTLENERFRLASILEGTNAGTWEWNVQTGETRFNERWAEMIGYTLDELSPVSIETWSKYCHPDDFEQSTKLLERHFRGESEYYECETRMKHKNGNWVWVFDRGKAATWTEDGKPEWIYGTHQDLTERRQAEEALIKNKEFFTGIVENIPTMVFMKEVENFTFYLVNKAAEETFGIKREE